MDKLIYHAKESLVEKQKYHIFCEKNAYDVYLGFCKIKNLGTQHGTLEDLEDRYYKTVHYKFKYDDLEVFLQILKSKGSIDNRFDKVVYKTKNLKFVNKDEIHSLVKIGNFKQKMMKFEISDLVLLIENFLEQQSEITWTKDEKVIFRRLPNMRVSRQDLRPLR